MAKRPGVTQHGTAKQLADNGVGYTASGESEWSRQAASNGNAKMQSAEPDQVRGVFKSKPKEDLIYRNRHAIRKLARKMKTETDPIKLAKLKKHYEIKSMFLSKLEGSKHEHQSQASATGPATVGPKPGEISESWNWETVEDIPGESDVDPW